MEHEGVHCDTGPSSAGRAMPSRHAGVSSTWQLVRRELQIIRDDLHANAVRGVGSDVDRLLSVTRVVLDLGLEVWFSPAFLEYHPRETASLLVAAAAGAAPLEACHRGRVTFIAGFELTLFMQDLIVGKTIPARLGRIKSDPSLLGDGKLDAFLEELVPRLGAVFGSPLTYASLVFEQVDWGPFDFVGVDHYR
jgi:hypothetical protein